MKNKVGIITIVDNRNYGNRLQNFALSYFIQKNTDAEAVTIRNRGFEDYSFIEKWSRERGENWLRQTKAGDWFIRMVRKKRDEKKPFYHQLQAREEKFTAFNRKHMIFTSYELCSYKQTHKCLSDFCLLITGSDQVWNPQFQRATRIDFLQFAPLEKRVSYAASIGVSSIPKDRVFQFSKYVSGMNDISVREETGKRLVESYSDKKVVVVCDPTLLLTQEEWISVAIKPNVVFPQKYILVYFLGEISLAQKNIIEVYARKTGKEIIYLNSVKDEKLYTIGPDEFVYMFSHADAIFTDSYHGCIFSILFHKNFWVFKRDKFDIYSRIQDLLACYGLQNREVSEMEQQLKSDRKSVVEGKSVN